MKDAIAMKTLTKGLLPIKAIRVRTNTKLLNEPMNQLLETDQIQNQVLFSIPNYSKE